MRLRVSEARLNDMCYMVLKKAFFEETLKSNPRECDIRVCMDMAAPERITSVMQAILSPDEVSGKSHEIFYEIDPGKVFDVCIFYLEDHWMKQEFPGDWKKGARQLWIDEMVPELMQLPEENCGA